MSALGSWQGKEDAVGSGEGATPRAGAASAAAPPALDLTTGHIPPQPEEEWKLYVPLGGSMCKLRGKNPHTIPPMPGLRGKAGFSSRSRKRLLQLVASLDRDTRPPLFLGLTYPGERWPHSPESWHDHIESFYKRLCRKYPMCNIAVLWRLEPQRRGGAPFPPARLWGALYPLSVGRGGVGGYHRWQRGELLAGGAGEVLARGDVVCLQVSRESGQGR